MRISIYVSMLGLSVQCAGAFLVAALFWLLSRGDPPPFQRRWAWAWSSLALSLASLGAAARSPSPLLLASYQFFELLFIALLVQGVRLLGGRDTSRRARIAVVAASAVWTLAVTLAAVALRPEPGADRISPVFAVHALVMAVGYGVAAAEAARAARSFSGFGPRLLAAGLGVLAVVFLVYSPMTLRNLGRGPAPSDPLLMSFSGFVDGLLQFVVSFAMLLCRTEHDQHRLTAFNLGLTDAHRKLEQTYALLRDEAERDPLTDAHNRLAFRHYWSEGLPRLSGGSVAVVDMNSLKTINDRHGHELGDRAIRLVADAIRGLFRPGEPLFRWGGDEFLLLLPGTSRDEAAQRLSLLNPLLEKAWDGPRPAPQACFGVETFGSPADFSEALKRADEAMYAAKGHGART